MSGEMLCHWDGGKRGSRRKGGQAFGGWGRRVEGVGRGEGGRGREWEGGVEQGLGWRGGGGSWVVWLVGRWVGVVMLLVV